jgi:murein DD-endopeptidase MepM/ murein hydrolase activator NlpD
MLSRCFWALVLVFLLPPPGNATPLTKSELLQMRRSATPKQVAMTGAFLPSRPRIAVPLARTETALLPPVGSPCISSPFGPRILPNRPQAGTYHYGIDLPAPEGAPVFATESGTLIRIQHKGPGGIEMLVQHDGYVGVYSHFGMVSPILAAGNATIVAGEKLGVVGDTGVTYGAHLYFEMLVDGKPVDPAPYLGVSACHGGIHRTRADMLDAGGKIPPTRHYASRD